MLIRLVLLFALGTAACTLLVDTGDLSGAAPTPPQDARDATDAPPSFVPTDDAGPLDATVDGGDGCPGTFCDSFDEGLLGERWTGADVRPATQLALGAPARSGPNALIASTTNVPNVNPYGFLTKELGSAKRVRCELSINVMKPPPAGSFADYFSLQVDSNSTHIELWLGTTTTEATLREDIFYGGDAGCACPRTSETPPPLPANKWVRVRYETDFASQSLFYDGKLVTATPLLGLPLTGPIAVLVGTRTYPATTSVAIDDLVCTLLP